MKKVLITGFEPFGDSAVNPSALIAKRAMGICIEGFEIVSRVLPVTFKSAPLQIKALLDEHRPELVLSFGVSNRPCINLERLAKNRCEGEIRDNDGFSPQVGELEPGAPAEYLSVFKNSQDLLERINQNGIPATFSDSAGSYVCNALMYAALRHIAENKMPTSYGFIHVPQLPETLASLPDKDKNTTGSMDIELSVKALNICLEYFCNKA